MLKRMTALFLAALLCAAAPLTMAEGGASPLDWLQKHISAAQTMAEGEVFTARDATLNKYTGTIAVRDEDSRYYRIINAAGEELLPAERYTSAYARNNGFFEVEVESEDGIHDEGLLDGQGRLLVPAEYADVNVISDRWQEISDRIIQDMGRGITHLMSRGGYTGTERPTLLCVISRSEIMAFKRILREIDENAFVIITEAHEAIGDGFTNLRDSGAKPQ